MARTKACTERNKKIILVRHEVVSRSQYTNRIMRMTILAWNRVKEC